MKAQNFLLYLLPIYAKRSHRETKTTIDTLEAWRGKPRLWWFQFVNWRMRISSYNKHGYANGPVLCASPHIYKFNKIVCGQTINLFVAKMR